MECGPCKVRALGTEAVKYCMTCQEAQCKTCYQVLISSKATRAHLVINIEDFNKDSKTVSDLVFFQRCSSHNKELIFFCTDHSHLLCSTCLLSARIAGCISVAEITSVGESLIENKFDDEIKSDLENVILQCLEDENEIQNLMQSAKAERENIKIMFRDIKQRVSLLLDNYERRILDKVDIHYKAEFTGLKQLLDSSRNISQNAKDNIAKLQTVKEVGLKADVFRCILSISDQLHHLRSVSMDQDVRIYKHKLIFSNIVSLLLEDSFPVVQCISLTSIKQPPQFPSVRNRRESQSKIAMAVALRYGRVSFTDCIQSSAYTESKLEEFVREEDKRTNKALKEDKHRPKEEIAGLGEVEKREVSCENKVLSNNHQKANTEAANPTKVSCNETVIKIRPVSNIRLHTPDGKQPQIDGVTTLDDGRLILSDTSGSRLIVLNENLTYCHELSLAETPGQVTALTPDSLAVCLPVSNRVAIISEVIEMEWKSDFKTLRSPRGIYAIDKNRIFVSMTNGKMEWYLNVLTPKGAVIVTIKNTSVLDAANISSTKLRNKFRHYLLCCKRSGFLYSFQPDGNVIFQYKMESPNGVCVDEAGLIYVVDSTGTLHVLTAKGELLQKISVPKGSNGITFNPISDCIVITSQTQSEISVYNITRERARQLPGISIHS